MGTLELVQKRKADLQLLANTVRSLGMDAVLKAKSGHVGVPLGCAEMGTLLYFGFMNHSPEDPGWINRDRFVLSAGHGSMLQYALLHLSGYGVELSQIENFRQLGSSTPGHPEYGHTPGIEVTTGPLGQGISNAVGLALAQRMLQARVSYSSFELMNHNTYVILGDGCMMEGVSSEASSLAGHLRLNKLVALYDCNNITIDGTVDITFTENVGSRYLAYGWNLVEADSHDFESLAKALDSAQKNTEAPIGTTGPTLIICKGVAGKGSPKWEGKPKIHGNPMSAEDVLEAKRSLKLPETAFFVSEECKKVAQELMSERSQKYLNWKKSLEQLSSQDKLWLLGSRQSACAEVLQKLESESAEGTAFWSLSKGKVATRAASGKALNHIASLSPLLIGGSADLAGSNNTTLSNSSFVSPESFQGRNIHFGVREHAMGAISNGLALHSNFVPYCATFAVFSDYLRPTIRLAALMNQPTVFLFTHDSYAVGEDGPTHQPIEHASSLRSIPNLNVIRPADGSETFAAWCVALESEKTPTALLLTRQDLESLEDLGAPRSAAQVLECVRLGAGLVKDYGTSSSSGATGTGTGNGKKSETNRLLTFVASGSEVSLVLNASKVLEEGKFEDLNGNTVQILCRVVSAPSPQKLSQNPILLNKLVPENVDTIAVEAGSGLGWGDVVGRKGCIISMNTFGASAPAAHLDSHFGFTPDKIALSALNHLSLRKS